MSALSPKDLLEQARQLITQERLRPRQVSLRRGVSAAYYSLFHLLVHEAARALTADGRLRLLLPRAFQHEEMGAACRTFASHGPLPALITTIYPALIVPPEIVTVAHPRRRPRA